MPTPHHFREHWVAYTIGLMAFGLTVKTISSQQLADPVYASQMKEASDAWVAPSLFIDHELKGDARSLVVYGESLIAHTASYFGPKGSIESSTNGLNCQNCHLQAGRKSFGNNYSAVAATYPKWRARSGHIESIASRVNDCFERSLNGTALDTNSREMKAIIAYIQWLGKEVSPQSKPKGSGIRTPAYLDRAADPVRGKTVYINTCQSCHGANGEGQSDPTAPEFIYPPLWGPHSYNTGAGLYRLSNFAGYVIDNMPFNQATHEHHMLSTEEAWDVAAFVNSMPRPEMHRKSDWPDISKKPVDHPFGPYADGFSEKQHKYGPFGPIALAQRR